jgi:hypothetical protein
VASDLHQIGKVVLFRYKLVAMGEVTVMRRILLLLFFLVINVAVPAGPVHSGESGLNDPGVKEETNKDECLLVAINCGSDFLTLEQMIEKLRREISKGRAVYTEDELIILRERLNNANKTLEFFKYEGAGSMYKYPGE